MAQQYPVFADLFAEIGNLNIETFLNRLHKLPIGEQAWSAPHVIADKFRVLATARNKSVRREILDELAKTSLLLVANSERTEWRGIDLSIVPPDQRLYSLLLLDDPHISLTQEVYNFLCGADIQDRRLAYGSSDVDVELWELPSGVSSGPSRVAEAGIPPILKAFADNAIQEMIVDPKQRQLAEAFISTMINEAKPHETRMVIGAYEMNRVPLPALDALIEYDTIRLVFQPGGIFASLVKDNLFRPLFWSPQRTSAWLYGAKVGWAINVVASGIWRDACVVKHRFVTERSRRIYRGRRRPTKKQRAVTVLPRIIRHVAWADDAERSYIIRQAHTVKEHYRELPQGWRTGEQGRWSAREYGYPDPPPGWTFVRRHDRGGKVGERVIKPRRVVCQGLRIARMALSVN